MFGDAHFDLEAVAAEDRSGWSAAARSEGLLELLGVMEQVRAEVIRCVDGYLDAETLQRLAQVLDALEPPDPVDAPTRSRVECPPTSPTSPTPGARSSARAADRSTSRRSCG